MIREIVKNTEETIKLGIVNSEIDSVRSQCEEKTTVRLYDKGLIGLSSAVGNVDLSQLTENAKKLLIFPISYPIEPTANNIISFEHSGVWKYRT